MAETGSVVLSEEALDDRIASLLPETHLVFLPCERIVPTLDEAADFLRRADGPYHSFLTGPSRTGDIECSPTIGVHGAKELWIALISSPGSRKNKCANSGALAKGKLGANAPSYSCASP